MSLVQFPGLIDVHVHLRDPGATYKEDFNTGTRAALKGGFTMVLDMPNNPGCPTLSPLNIWDKIERSKKYAHCYVGFYYGSNGHNLNTFKEVMTNPFVFGLKLYTNHTTGDLLVENPLVWKQIFRAWESDKPILVHAEGDHIIQLLSLAEQFNRNLHICHISKKEEIEILRSAKKQSSKISAGVTPHNLFLSIKDKIRLGNWMMIKPEIGLKEDQDSLWAGLLDGTIDLVESDHAPHTKKEKMTNPPAFGMPGLETTFGLMLFAYNKHRVTLDQIQKWLYENPKRLFHLPDQPNTYIEFDPEFSFEVNEVDLETKCKWSAFKNHELFGKIDHLVYEGKDVIVDTKLVI